MESTTPQPYPVPERRRSDRQPPKVIGRARIRRGLLCYPGFRLIQAAEDVSALPGYIWVDGPTRAEHVWAAHFEVQLFPEG